ncbi:MAG: Fe-S protein assembly co-chaperone HscB [Magnetococcus sp. DMHC-8]
MVADDAFCPTCQIIQPPDLDRNFFQLLGMPVAFSLDARQLQSTYQALQKQFHPDRFVRRSATERRLSLEHVTRLNQACQVLSDPLARSEYLLASLAPAATGQGAPEAGDPDFLLEVMEQREALAAVELTDAGAAEQLAGLRHQAEERMAHILVTLTTLFASCAPGVGPEKYRQIAQVNHRLRYHRRFLEALDQAEEKMLAGEDD